MIKEIFQLNKKYKNAWLWTDNKPARSLGVGFEASIHEYILKWYNTKDASTYPLMKDISLLYVEQYPSDVIACNDAGLSAMLTDDLRTAKKYFAQGYELDPADMLLLRNLARVCYHLGETESAYSYYSILAESEDPDDREYAEQILSTYFNQDE